MSKDKQKQSYLHGAAILTVAAIVIKILGFIYKIPLGNILEDEGFAHFNIAYNIYSFLLTISTAGLPVVLSKMIAEANALNRPMQAKRTFNVAMCAFLVMGTLGSLAMLLFPEELAAGIDSIGASQSVLALSPAVVLVCILSAYRGYMQGYSKMTPTSVSQVIEVAVKVIIGLALAFIASKAGRSLPEVSAAAIVGVPVGTLAACIYVFVVKRRFDKERAKEISQDKLDTPDSVGSILLKLIKFGLPITMGASISSIITLLDTKLTMNRLQRAAGFTYGQSTILYGVYSRAVVIFNLPAAIITPLTISLVPAIAESVAYKDYDEARNITETSLRITSIIALPMAIGISVLSDSIIPVLYKQSAAQGPALLAVLGIASYFVSVALVSTSILQAYGAERLPVIAMITGGVVKIVVNWVLVSNREINIYGAPVGTLCCYVVMAVMNYIFLQKKVKQNLNLAKILAKPLISSVTMGAAAYAVYGLCSRFLGGADITRMQMAISMFVAIGIGVLIYFIMIISLRAITSDDLKLLPKGDKIAKLLRIK